MHQSKSIQSIFEHIFRIRTRNTARSTYCPGRLHKTRITTMNKKTKKDPQKKTTDIISCPYIARINKGKAHESVVNKRKLCQKRYEQKATGGV